MTLSVFDRLLLLNILPAQGDITTLRIVRDLQSALAFSEEEHKALEITNEGGQVRWKKDAEQAVGIDIGSVGRAIIRDRLVELNEQKMLKMEHLSLYERFVESKE
jgi:hypothetical protein